MKKILIFLFGLFMVSESYAQCSITAFSNQSATLDCGDSLFVEFSAYGSLSLSDTFTAGGPSDTGWVSTSGAQYDEPYIPSPTNDDYFWMGPSAVTPTALTTVAYDVSGGGQICFDFVYADGNSGGYAGGGVPEQPDQYDEGISLQYNNGSGWVDIIYYPPIGGTLPGNPGVATPNTSGPGAYETWTSVCVNIPPGAMTTSTSFQWVQENNSGACCDHWGLDNITISSANPAYNIYSVESNQNLGPSPVTYGALPTTDSTFNFYYTAGLADTCYTSFTSYMNPTDLGPDLILDCNQNIVQLQALGVSPNDNFTWSPITGLSDPTILNPMASPLDTTEYIFNSSCGADTMVVNVVANYSFSTSDDTTICVGDSALLEVYGGAQTYAWTPNDGSISDTTLANPVFTPTQTTTYTVVTDSAGCIKTNDITVNVSNKMFNLFFLTGAGCNGGTGGLTAISSPTTPELGAFTYSLDNGDSIINQSNGAFPGLEAGVYTITLNDTMTACPIDSTFTVTGGLNITIDSVYSTNPLCVGDTSGSIEVYIDTNVVAMYSLNGGTPQSSNIFTGLTDGIYNISAQFGTCPAATAIDTLSAPATVDAVFVDSTDLTCGGSGDGQIVVSAVQGVGPYTYSQDNITFQTDSFFNNLDAGNYVIYAMDNNGCRDSIITSISEPIPLMLSNVVINPTACFGDSTGSISFDVNNGTAPYQYSIDSGLSFQSANSFGMLPAGPYVLLATDTNGCFSNAVNDTITEPTAVVLIEDSTSSSTCGAADGVIYMSATGGTNTFTYSIDTGANFVSSGTFTGLTAGLYNIIVNDGNGCSDNLNVSVANFGAPTLSITSFDSVDCNGGNNAFVQLSATGGSGSYQFSNGGGFQNDSLFNNLSGGLNNFIVEDAIGCQGTVSITIYEPAALNISATQDSTSCFGTADGEITIAAMGGTAPYFYAVDDTSTAQLNPNFTGFSAGTYMTYLADANGCIDSLSQTVFEADTIIVNNIVVDSVNCFGAADGQISFGATGGILAYTYSIDGGTTFGPLNSFTVDTGSYDLMIEDAEGCQSDVYAVSVFQPADLELDSTNAIMTNCGLNNGSLEVTASGGIAPYSYSLNAGMGQASGLFNTNIAAMTHTVVVTDANNCTETINIVVDSIPNLSLSVMSFDSVSCGGAADASVTLSATGGMGTYMYTVNGGTAQTSPTFTGLSGGNNVFVVSDSIGNCTATVTENIYEPTTLTLTATQDSVSCNSFADGQITLTALGGGSNYVYALNDTNTVQVSNVFTGLSAGVDTAYVIDENGCFASVIQNVEEPDTLIITNVNPLDISCSADGSFTVDAQGGTPSYLYNINGGATQTSNVFTLSVGGTYTLGVTDANGCPTATMIDSIIAPDPVTLVVDSSTAALACNNQNDGFIGIAASGGSGPYTYSINAGAFQVDSFFNNLSAGNYTILVQDMFNCESAPTTVTITEPNALAGTTSSTGVSCNGVADGSITINTITGGTAPFTVEVDGVSNPYTANMVFANLAAGNYPIQITDDNGCTLTLNENVGDVSALSLSASTPTNVSCFGAADGEISVSASGGTPNYDFTITLGAFTQTVNSASSATFSNLEGTEAGLVYTISITDANGCSANLTQTITQPNQLVIEGIDTSALSCFGANDATLSVRASGGSIPYTYVWTPSGQTSSLATGLAPGVYSVDVTDANNCTVTASQTILDVAPVLATITPDSAHISMGDTLNLGVSVQNALGTTLQYAWSPSEGLSCTDCADPAVTVYNDIAYSVIVTDENGCTSFNFTEVYITVEDSLFYFIPNAFSPGSDGINDVFQVLGQDIQSVELTIFNRWGEKVFEGENQYISWDGTYKGILQNPGIYSFVAKIKFLNDAEVVKKGSVTLLR